MLKVSLKFKNQVRSLLCQAEATEREIAESFMRAAATLL